MLALVQVPPQVRRKLLHPPRMQRVEKAQGRSQVLNKAELRSPPVYLGEVSSIDLILVHMVMPEVIRQAAEPKVQASGLVSGSTRSLLSSNRQLRLSSRHKLKLRHKLWLQGKELLQLLLLQLDHHSNRRFLPACLRLRVLQLQPLRLKPISAERTVRALLLLRTICQLFMAIDLALIVQRVKMVLNLHVPLPLRQ